MTTSTDLTTSDEVRNLQGEEHAVPPVAGNSPSGRGGDSSDASSDPHPSHPENGRWHDIARLLVFIWGVFSSLAIGAPLSVIPYTEPTTSGLLYATYAGCALAPWAVVFLVWRWPAAGFFALVAGFPLWFVFACQQPQVHCGECFLLCPALLTLPPAMAIALHLRER